MVTRSITSLARLCTSVVLVVLGTTALAQISAAVPAAAAEVKTATQASGPVYAWGYNQAGQLGDGTSTGPAICAPSFPCSSKPIQVLLPSGVTATAIAGGGGEVGNSPDGAGYAIGSDGNLYAWGANNFGQLGDGSTTNSDTPVVVSLPSGVSPTAVAAGGPDNAYAIGSDGKLYAWGDNAGGQLGDGFTTGPDTCPGAPPPRSTPCSTTPMVVSLPSGVTPTSIAAGNAAYAIGSDGKLYAWGDNASGELGDGTTTDSDTPVVVSLPSGVTPTAIAAGENGYSIGSDGNLYAWGGNSQGGLGNGNSTGPDQCESGFACSTTPVVVSLPPGVIPTAIAGNLNDGYAIGSDGNLYAWGYNGDAELGNGTATGPDMCDSLGPCGTTPARVLLPLGVSPTAIAGGAFDGYAIGSDGSIYAWGLNEGGELGDGTTTDSSTPVVVSFLGGSTPLRLAPGPTSGSAYVIVTAAPLTITTSSLPDGSVWKRTARVHYSATLNASGGNPPYHWLLAAGSKPLPPGLTLHRRGVISGKATSTGTYSFVVKVVDRKTRKTKAVPSTQHSATAVLSITITPSG